MMDVELTSSHRHIEREDSYSCHGVKVNFVRKRILITTIYCAPTICQALCFVHYMYYLIYPHNNPELVIIIPILQMRKVSLERM